MSHFICSRSLSQLTIEHRPYAIATALFARSAPRQMLIESEEKITGGLGDAAIDNFVIRQAVNALQSKTNKIIQASVLSKIKPFCHKDDHIIISIFNTSSRPLVFIRGAGDIATGIAAKLHNMGYPIVMTEIEQPTTIRRSVAFSQAVFDGEVCIENIQACFSSDVNEISRLLQHNKIVVIVDPKGEKLKKFRPYFLIDAILAKRNINTCIDMAPIVIGLGPGFTAGKDCHAVIETSRGHFLGSIIYQGSALPNTGIPGNIAGFTSERVLRASANGIMHHKVKLGDIVEQGDIVAWIGDTPVIATISGMMRGLLHNGLSVKTGLKIGDIDPRGNQASFTTISDKARAIAGGVVEAMQKLSG